MAKTLAAVKALDEKHAKERAALLAKAQEEAKSAIDGVVDQIKAYEKKMLENIKEFSADFPQLVAAAMRRLGHGGAVKSGGGSGKRLGKVEIEQLVEKLGGLKGKTLARSEIASHLSIGGGQVATIVKKYKSSGGKIKMIGEKASAKYEIG